MHDVLVVFCQDSVIILASSKTINHLKQVSWFELVYLNDYLCYVLDWKWTK
jgi:hypothetical protein